MRPRGAGAESRWNRSLWRLTFTAMQGVPACPQCGNADSLAEEWVGISRDGTTYGSTVLTCNECHAHFKPDGELLTLSSPEEMERDGTPLQYKAFTEIEKDD